MSLEQPDSIILEINAPSEQYNPTIPKIDLFEQPISTLEDNSCYIIDPKLNLSNYAFIESCKKGNIDNVKKYLDQKLFQDSWKNGMMYSAKYGHFELLNIFINLGINNYNYALLATGFTCCVKMAQYLIELGANEFKKAFEISLFYNNDGMKELSEYNHERWKEYVLLLISKDPSIVNYALNNFRALLDEEKKLFLRTLN